MTGDVDEGEGPGPAGGGAVEGRREHEPEREHDARDVARRFDAAASPWRLLLGSDERHATAAWLFLRAVGLVYVVAFLSLYPQVAGLIGPRGLVPAADLLERARGHVALFPGAGEVGLSALPTVFLLLGASDRALEGVCLAGGVLGALVMLDVAPALALALCWALYLSISVVGAPFLNFQWDALLLEAGLVAVFLAPWRLAPRGPRRAEPPPHLALFTARLLLAKLMLLSGLVKLTWLDRTWLDLTALTFHYETQPLPTRLGWVAHQSPHWLAEASCAAMYAIELGAPLLAFGPGRIARAVAAAGLLSLQVMIGLTGTYGFFNLLSTALCIPLLDDRFLSRLFVPVPVPAPETPPRLRVVLERIRRAALVPLAFVALSSALVHLADALHGHVAWGEGARGLLSLAEPLRPVCDAVEPTRSFNGYGLFRVMTTERDEVEIEGSDDGDTWRPYVFRWKPGPVERAPAVATPHMPRLDWQMWFAPFEGPDEQPRGWFMRLLERLLEGEPAVLGLLERNPFPDRPPRLVMARLYRYRFTDRATREATGAWWTREEKGVYCPPVGLK